MQLGAIVLAGGRSRRMGQPKEALAFRDSTFLCYTVEVLEHCCHPVVVVARDQGQELPPMPIETDVTFDEQPGEGPLIGIASGMRAVASACDAVFVTPCDAPFVSERAVGWLADHLGDADMVIPRVGGTLQPLTAVYRTSVLPAIDRLIAAGERKPRALVEQVNARVLDEAEVDAFDPDRRFLRSVNSPEEYQALLDEFGQA